MKNIDKELFNSTIIKLSQTRVTVYDDTLICSWCLNKNYRILYVDLFLHKLLTDKIKSRDYTIKLYLTHNNNTQHEIGVIDYKANRYCTNKDSLKQIRFYKLSLIIPTSSKNHEQFRIKADLMSNNNVINSVTSFKLEIYNRDIPLNRVKEQTVYDLLYNGIRQIKDDIRKKRQKPPNNIIKRLFHKKPKYYAYQDSDKYEQILKYFKMLLHLKNKNHIEFCSSKTEFNRIEFNNFVKNYSNYDTTNNILYNPWYILIYLKEKYNKQFIGVFGKYFSFKDCTIFPVINDLLYAIDDEAIFIKDTFDKYNKLAWNEMVNIVLREVEFLFSFKTYINIGIASVILFCSNIIELECGVVKNESNKKKTQDSKHTKVSDDVKNKSIHNKNNVCNNDESNLTKNNDNNNNNQVHDKSYYLNNINKNMDSDLFISNVNKLLLISLNDCENINLRELFDVLKEINPNFSEDKIKEKIRVAIAFSAYEMLSEAHND